MSRTGLTETVWSWRKWWAREGLNPDPYDVNVGRALAGSCSDFQKLEALIVYGLAIRGQLQ